LAATKNVARHHEPFVGIDSGAGSNYPRPPTSTWVGGIRRAGNMRIAGQRVKHKNRVVACGVQGSPRFERHRDFWEHATELKARRDRRPAASTPVGALAAWARS